MAKIYIIDVTNRDGVQTARLGLAKIEKTMINFYLNQMGIFQSEFGFPITKHEINYLKANLQLAKKKALFPIKLSGWMRALKEDVTAAFNNVHDLEYINLSISTSDQMIDGKFLGKKSFDDIIREMTTAVQEAKSCGAKGIGVNAEDASRTDIKKLIDFSLAAKDQGAERIRYCDTLGCDSPFSIYERIYKIAEKIKMPVELHCHNDLGMAVACSIAGAKAANDAGVDAYINTTINGMGERAGNADLVAVILAAKYSQVLNGNYKLDSRIDLSMAWKIAHYASYAFKVPIPINQIGVGANAFAHSSGIHVDGALKDRRNYELYDYEELGRGEPEIIETGRMILLGEYSGIKGLRNIYGKLEIEFKNDEEARKVLELARYANVHKQKPVTEDELRFIAQYPEECRLLMTVTP
ncbi:MAG: homocitrate synthase [Candidatus Omnitrophica bacterium]|nr:homocitrate synthase [Candidatus Omnitrophota bacterium]